MNPIIIELKLMTMGDAGKENPHDSGRVLGRVRHPDDRQQHPSPSTPTRGLRLLVPLFRLVLDACVLSLGSSAEFPQSFDRALRKFPGTVFASFVTRKPHLVKWCVSFSLLARESNCIRNYPRPQLDFILHFFFCSGLFPSASPSVQRPDNTKEPFPRG